MGFPGRLSHRGLGGNRKNVFKVTDPERQLDVAKWNAVQWQVAGMNRVSPLVTLTIAADGSRTSGAEAWNDQDDPALRVAITHDTLGQYQIEAAATYPDENGVETAVEFHGATVTVQAVVPIVAVYSLDSATLITVYLFDPLDSFNPVDAAITVDVK